jgi:enamine deaminase RidA (YjgF/YER057c/UK114 family)
LLQHRVLENLSTILKAAGSSLASVIELNIFITSMDDFKAMDEVYDKFFSKFDQKPVGHLRGGVASNRFDIAS